MDEINLLDYIQVLLKRKWTIIAVTAVVTLFAAIALVIMPRTYEGQTTLLFPQKSDSGIGSKLAQLSGLPMFNGVAGLSGREIYVTVLGSRTISETVLRRLDLERKYDLEWKDLQDNLVISPLKEGGLSVGVLVPTSWLKGHVPTSNLKDQTARLAADITNTYVDELRIYNTSNALFASRKNRLFVESQLDRSKRDLDLAEDRLEQFQQDNPTLIPPEKSSAYAEQTLDLSSKQSEAEVAAREAERQLASARYTWRAGAPEGVSPEALINNPTIEQLRQQAASLEVKRATLLEDFTENHPDVVSVSQEVEKTNDRIRTEVGHIVSGRSASIDPARQELLKQLVLSEINYDSLKARCSALADAVSEAEKRASGLPPKEMQYVRLLRDVKTSETVYTTLLAEHARAQLDEARDSDGFIILDAAIAPEKPSKPKIKLTLSCALILGMMLGVLIATAQGMTVRK